MKSVVLVIAGIIALGVLGKVLRDSDPVLSVDEHDGLGRSSVASSDAEGVDEGRNGQLADFAHSSERVPVESVSKLTNGEVSIRSRIGASLSELHSRSSSHSAWSRVGWDATSIHWVDQRVGVEYYLPGHEIVKLESGEATELELEPASLLSISLKGGGILEGESYVRRARQRQGEIKSFTFSETPSRLAIAASAVALDGKGSAGSISFGLSIDSNWRVEGAWRTFDSGEAEVVLPDLPMLNTLPLTVSVDGLIGSANSEGLKCEIHLNEKSSILDFAETYSSEYPWGNLRVRPLGPEPSLVVGEQHGAPVWTFDNLIVGESYTVTIHDLNHSLYARLAFNHDGSPVVVELRPTPRLHFTLLDALTFEPVSDESVVIDFQYGGDDCEENKCAWNSRQEVWTDGAGSIIIPTVVRTPFGMHTPYPAPERGSLTLRVNGYDSMSLDVDTVSPGPNAALEMGDLFVSRATPTLSISGTSGRPVGRSYLHFPERMNTFPIYLDVSVYSVRSGVGTCDLFLNEDEDEGAVRKALELGSCTYLVLQEIQGSLVPLELVGEAWMVQSAKRVQVDLEFGTTRPGVNSYELYLEWHGVRVNLGRSIPGQRAVWTFDLPLEGAFLRIESQDSGGTVLSSDAFQVKDGDHLSID